MVAVSGPFQLRDPGDRLVVGSLVRDDGVPFGLDLGELLEHQLQAIELARELAPEARWLGFAVVGHQSVQALSPAGLDRLIVGDALQDE
jgi:hypothetical protein